MAESEDTNTFDNARTRLSLPVLPVTVLESERSRGLTAAVEELGQFLQRGNKENIPQAVLNGMAQSGTLRNAENTSMNNLCAPFYCYRENTSGNAEAVNTGRPDLAHRLLPVVLEIKCQNFPDLIAQCLKRAYSMITFNCLLKEVVVLCSMGTERHNWAIRVTKQVSYEEDKVGIQYLFRLVPLKSLDHLFRLWDIFSTKKCCDTLYSRFFDEDWLYVVAAVCKAAKLDPFHLYHQKISLQACSSSRVYTVHDNNMQSVQGSGYEAATSGGGSPILAVKVNHEEDRNKKEFDVVSSLLSPAVDGQDPADDLARFHVLSCTAFYESVGPVTFVNPAIQIADLCPTLGEIKSLVGLQDVRNSHGKDEGSRKVSFASTSTTTKSSSRSSSNVCWWNPSWDDIQKSGVSGLKNCVAEDTNAARPRDGEVSEEDPIVTVTVMRCGIPLRDAMELCPPTEQDREFVLLSLERWMGWIHAKGWLHCDARTANILVFPLLLIQDEELSDGHKKRRITTEKYSNDTIFRGDTQLIDFDLAHRGPKWLIAETLNQGAQKDMIEELLWATPSARKPVEWLPSNDLMAIWCLTTKMTLNKKRK